MCLVWIWRTLNNYKYKYKYPQKGCFRLQIYVVQKLHVSVVCGLFYCSIPTKVTARHILKVATSSVQAFLSISKNISGKWRSTVSIWILVFSFCKRNKFFYIFLPSGTFLRIRHLLVLCHSWNSFCIRTSPYMFLHSLNVNSCKESLQTAIWFE